MPSVEYDGDWAVIRFEGDIDLATVVSVRDTVERLMAVGNARLRFDVGGVEFIDSRGLALFIGAYQRARRAGGEFQVVGASDAVRRAFGLSGLGWLLDAGQSGDE